MKTYEIRYYLGTMYHNYCIDAENEAEAITKAIKHVPAKDLINGFEISRYYEEWN